MNDFQAHILADGPPFRREHVPYPTYKDIALQGQSIRPGFGEQYPVTIPGEPVPKATGRPPKGQGAYVRVMTDKKWKALAKTWLFQDKVAGVAFDGGIPVFDKEDPIWMDCWIFMGNRRLIDRKNVLAAVEDGLAWGKFVYNDKQITGGSEQMAYNCDVPRVDVVLKLDNRILNSAWLINTLGGKAKARRYYEKLGYGVKACVACGNPFPVREEEVIACSCMQKCLTGAAPMA